MSLNSPSDHREQAVHLDRHQEPMVCFTRKACNANLPAPAVDTGCCSTDTAQIASLCKPVCMGITTDPGNPHEVTHVVQQRHAWPRDCGPVAAFKGLRDGLGWIAAVVLAGSLV